MHIISFTGNSKLTDRQPVFVAVEIAMALQFRPSPHPFAGSDDSGFSVFVSTTLFKQQARL